MKKLIVLGLLLTTFVCITPANADFIGYYDVSNWTTTVTPVESDASVSTASAPASIVLTSGDNGIGDGHRSTVDFTIAAATGGLVSFLWDYDTFDVDGSGLDPFGFLLNGVFSQLTQNGLFSNQTNTFSFAVNSGDIFGFRQIATDSIEGSGVTTISNFSASASVPEPSTLLLLGSGLVGLALWRRKHTA